MQASQPTCLQSQQLPDPMAQSSFKMVATELEADLK